MVEDNYYDQNDRLTADAHRGELKTIRPDVDHFFHDMDDEDSGEHDRCSKDIVTTYGFDLAENLTSIIVNTAPAIRWTGPADNVNQLKKSNTQAINYDVNGNLLDDGKHHYSYDAENRLIKIVNNQNGHISTFLYDGAGKRVAILEQDNAVGPTTETRYVWSGEKIVSAYQDGVQKTLYYPQGEYWGRSFSLPDNSILF